MDDFTMVYDEPINEENYFATKRHLICNTCGARVETGIFNVSGHWVECSGKGFTEALMKIAEEKKGKITLEDVENVKKKENKEES